MFKGFQDTLSGQMFRGFPARISSSYNAYGKGGLLLWFDAAYNKNTNVNNDKISYWIDRVQGLVASQSTVANQPTYIATDSLFNNNPSIYFPVQQALLLNNTFPLGGNTTLAIVCRSISNNMYQQSTLLSQGSNVGFASGGTLAGSTGYGFYTGSGSPYIKSTIEDTSSHIIVINKDRMIIDGVDIAVSLSGRFISAVTMIGSGNGNNYPQTYIAEILLYNNVFSSSDCIEICNNINKKYLIY